MCMEELETFLASPQQAAEEHYAARKLAAAIGWIAGHPDIAEVILTGGDPLILSARRIDDILSRLGAIRHVRRLRIHTRVPVAAPERITGELVAALKTRYPELQEMAGHEHIAPGRKTDPGACFDWPQAEALCGLPVWRGEAD